MRVHGSVAATSRNTRLLAGSRCRLARRAQRPQVAPYRKRHDLWPIGFQAMIRCHSERQARYFDMFQPTTLPWCETNLRPFARRCSPFGPRRAVQKCLRIIRQYSRTCLFLVSQALFLTATAVWTRWRRPVPVVVVFSITMSFPSILTRYEQRPRETIGRLVRLLGQKATLSLAQKLRIV